MKGEGRHIGALTSTKATEWQRCSPQTALDLIAEHETGVRKYTEVQLAQFRKIAAEDTRKGTSKKRAKSPRVGKGIAAKVPVRQKDETVESYVARLKAAMA